MSPSKVKTTSFNPDDRQQEAIDHIHGPMLVIAGAGTGKTSVLIHRIARLIEQGHATPDEILALTYTVAAAGEMRDRVRALIGKQIRCTTFHDFCLDLLKRCAKDFRVLDEYDLWIYLRRRIHELHLEHYVRAANVGQFLKDLIDFLSRCHDELITPEKYADYVSRLERGLVAIPRVAKSKNQLTDEEVIARCQEISRVFSTTERWMLEENLGTFGHMMTRAHDLITRDEALLAAERARSPFILVDEFQDANFAQIKILSALAGEKSNVFGVGDPDQAIYRFRGASSAAFHLFRRHFPAARLVVLGNNRRSTTPILQCAFALIDKNPPVFSNAAFDSVAYRRTPLLSARDETAKQNGTSISNFPVEAISFSGKTAEAPDVVHMIQDLKRSLHCRWRDFAVLYRSHIHRDEAANELASRGIPFFIENMDVSDTPEVRNLFACVAVVVDLGSDASLFRVAALPQFQVDPQQLRQALRAIARESKEGITVPLASVLESIPGGREVLECVRRARDEVTRKNAKTRAALELIGKQFDLDLNSATLRSALKFAAEWEAKPITKTKELGEWIDYLEHFREAGGVIPMQANSGEDAVRLMSVHGAKGLEFSHVFVLRAGSNSFPSSYRETLVEFPKDLRDPDSDVAVDDKTLHDQEERRLFYVAMTRAKDSLRIYGKQGTGKDKTPPAYLRELITNSSLKPWLRQRSAVPSQPQLLELAAAAEDFPIASHLPAWLDLPPVEGLASRLSASAVETYETCPLQFKFEREWKLSRDLHPAAQYGAAMHRVLRTCFDSIRLNRPKTDEDLLALFREDLAACGIEDDYQRGLYLQQGIQQLTEFLTTLRSSPAPDVLHTEEWFEVQIAGTKVAGRIDRVDRAADGKVNIIDYKTGKARPQEDANESLQLSIYAIAAQQKWGYQVGDLIFQNLEGNVAVSSKRSEFDLEEARGRIQSAARDIADGDFHAKTGYHCNFCAFRSLCPAREKRAPNPSSDSSTVAPAG